MEPITPFASMIFGILYVICTYSFALGIFPDIIKFPFDIVILMMYSGMASVVSILVSRLLFKNNAIIAILSSFSIYVLLFGLILLINLKNNAKVKKNIYNNNNNNNNINYNNNENNGNDDLSSIKEQ
jgi:hypothetical protein